MFEVKPLPILGAFVIETRVHEDSRGLFEVFWEEPILAANDIRFCPTNAHHSYNRKEGTLRGLHFQKSPYGQAKLVSCVAGSIWDVMVDLRPDSPTFQQWHSNELVAGSGRSIFIPAGCAHGFVTTRDDSTLAYLIDGSYSPNAGSVLKWNDPDVAIPWPVREPIISDKDAQAPGWNECEF